MMQSADLGNPLTETAPLLTPGLRPLTVLSVTTFCTSVREFSPLEVCAGQSKNVPLGWLRDLAMVLGPAHWFGPERHIPVLIRSAPRLQLRLLPNWLAQLFDASPPPIPHPPTSRTTSAPHKTSRSVLPFAFTPSLPFRWPFTSSRWADSTADTPNFWDACYCIVVTWSSQRHLVPTHGRSGSREHEATESAAAKGRKGRKEIHELHGT